MLLENFEFAWSCFEKFAVCKKCDDKFFCSSELIYNIIEVRSVASIKGSYQFNDAAFGFNSLQRVNFLSIGEPEGIDFFDDFTKNVWLVAVYAGSADDKDWIADGNERWFFKGANKYAAGSIINNKFID